MPGKNPSRVLEENMKLKDMSKLELEVLSYTDLTYMILKERKTTMNTPSIFKEICSLLEYSDADYENKIGDYYTSLTLDKRFVLLDTAEWDLRENHSVALEYDEEEPEDLEEALDEDDESEDIDEENVDTIRDDEDLEDDEIPLTIVEEESEEEM